MFVNRTLNTLDFFTIINIILSITKILFKNPYLVIRFCHVIGCRIECSFLHAIIHYLFNYINCELV